MRILVVEDEIELQHSIAEGLRLDAYAVDSCGDGLEAQALIAVEIYDLIILDLNLPGLDGFSLLQELRRENGDVKVLILSARDSLEDKIQGLDLGANDYLTKPFNPLELVARVKAQLRRYTRYNDQER
ncbi:MAG: response regulator, partial [Oscillospiraceae bacterium]